MMNEKTTRAEVVAAAREWLGTRWHHQGRLKGVGVDCAGLIIGVARELELVDFDYSNYGRVPDGQNMTALCRAQMTPVKLSEIAPGDVLLMRFDSDPQHLAFVGDYLGGDGLSIIHAYTLARKVIETRLDSVWRSRIVEAYSLPGVE